MPPIERALVRTVPWLLGGLVASVPLLLVDPAGDPIRWFLIQLAALVLIAVGLTFALLDLADEGWFLASGWTRRIRVGTGGVSIVVLVTGTTGLITLASSAAIGFDPSVQFLQLLSALDIAWAGAALMVGTAWLANRRVALVAGAVLGVVCIWSIARYLSIVGLGPDGAWVVSGQDLMRYVIPFDIVAAVAGVVVFLLGLRAALRRPSSPNPSRTA